MDIEYQLVAPEQFGEAVKLFDDHFLTDEPIMKSLGPSHLQSDIDKMNRLVLSFLKHNLSWCAIDKSTGRMVGVRITYSQSLADLPDAQLTFDELVSSGWSNEWASVMFLLDAMLDAKEILTSYKESKMLELFAVGVNSDYRNRGIASELVRRTLDHAVAVGHTIAGVVCTSIYTQKLFEKQGFEKVKEEYYGSYINAGTNSTLFQNVDKVHKSVVSYVKKLL